MGLVRALALILVDAVLVWVREHIARLPQGKDPGEHGGSQRGGGGRGRERGRR